MELIVTNTRREDRQSVSVSSLAGALLCQNLEARRHMAWVGSDTPFGFAVGDWFKAEPRLQRTDHRLKCRWSDIFGCPRAYTRTRMRQSGVRITVNRLLTSPIAVEPRWS